jgi:hypothetical protein
MMVNANWGNTLMDRPIKGILARCSRKKVDLESAAKRMDWVCEIAGFIATNKGETLEEQILWKGQYISKSLLDALISQKGGYKTMIEISEKSLPLSATIDQIEQEYGGKQMTMKCITDPDRAIAAEKLLKARTSRRKKLVSAT